jgi:gliding motility-associated-like protein
MPHAMKIWFRVLMSLFLLGCLRSSAQNITNKGKDFWVGYGHHQYMEPGQGNTQDMVLYFSAEQAANVRLTIFGRAATQVLNYSIAANTVMKSIKMPKAGSQDVRLYDVPPSFGGNGGEGLFPQSIHIESDVPIVAYAHIYASVSSGATMLLPTEAWGYAYYSINSQQIDAGGPGFSWVYVIAKENNTKVEITPSVITRLNKPAGVPFTVTLNKGEIYQIIGQSDGSGNGNQFTNTKVKSVANSSGQCFPIAVFSGSSRTRGESVPCGSGSGRDNDMQQAFPYHAWGKRFLTAPFATSSSRTSLNPSGTQISVYKIVTKDPATTTVTRNGTPLTANAAGYYQFSSNTADYIESTQPIMVGQFMSGAATCNPGGNGDPEMVFLSPMEQAISSVGFYRNDTTLIYTNWVTAIVPANGVASMTIDGVPVTGQPNTYIYTHTRNPNYKVVVKGWAAAQKQVLMRSDSAFTAVTYGLGSAESYAYNAGTFLKNLNAVSSIQNILDSTVKQHQFTCTKTPVQLSVLMGYKPLSLVWQLSTLSSVLSPSANVTQAPAIPSDTVYVDGIKYYKYTLPGTYMFSQPGTYSIPIVSTSPTIDNCSSSEVLSVDIVVKRSPLVNFIWNSMSCSLDSLHLKGDTLLAPFQENRYTWNFLPSGADRPGRTLDTLVAPGCYSIKLTAISTEGCLGDTTRSVCITAGPNTNIIANDTTICVGDSIIFTSASGGPGNWVWQYGVGNNFVTYADNNPHAVRYDTAGTFTVKHLFNAGGSCTTDTARLVVTVYSKPKPSFTVPDSCLGPSSPISFTNTTSIADTQTISTWSWNFADPLSGAANTSSVKNPTHLYSAPNFYNVKLGATTYNGCFKDTVITIQVKLKAVLFYPPLAPICQNAGGTVSVASAVVTNGVNGTGVYSGPGTDAAGNFNPAVAGSGTHTIKYVFTSDAGCKDSVTRTITVAARPVVSFSWPGGNCLTNGDVTFTNNSSVSGGATLTYTWDFGHPASGSANTSTLSSPTHTFTPGSYSIKLTAQSSSGCAADTTIIANFSIKPTVTYSALTPVCENVAGTVSVANGSNTNAVPGTGVYRGPFTDAAGNFNPSLAGAGSYTIWYVYTSNTGNCADSASQVMVVKPRPLANFTVPGNGCLTNDTVYFTNTSSIIGNLPMTYSWNFGDVNATPGNPNTSTATNPWHKFQSASYSIQLTAVGSNNCTGDTTITINFTIKPQLAYGALSPVCVSQSGPVSVALGSVTNGVPGTGIYRGPGTDAAGNFTPSAAGPGTHTIWYIFNTAGTCVDSVSRSILVRDRPHPNFTFPAGCLPVNGAIQFSNASTIGDGQAMTYSWDFNDPNAGAGNPNTSPATSPTHNYTNTGTYNIKLTVTTPNGCSADTTITATLSVKPQLAYPSLTSLCENATPVSVATASVTNNVTGTGTYGGGVAGLDAAGNFNPSVAGPGAHTVKYYFTSTGGCVDSISQTITVHPKPRPNFTFPNGNCMPTGTVSFTNASTIAGATPMTYSWDFGHPASGAANTSVLQSPSHTFNDATYAIKLTATSNQGCQADTTISATFSVQPQLAYPALADVCENATGTVSVATASVTNSLAGTGTYSGTATDAAGNFNPSVAGPGTYTITYTFATASGCMATKQSSITVKPRPHPAFTFPAGGCLVTGLVQLTNTTPALSGSTLSWTWDFNDPNADASNPNTSTAQNPTHTFGANTFNIKLTAIGSNGCSGDTTIPVNFSIKPRLAYPAPAAVCASVNGTVSIAGASVTNGVPGNGIYSGTGVDAAGNFNPSQAGAGTHNITYTYTSSTGCVTDTIVKIVVYPKPAALFTVTQDICLDKLATVTDASSVTGGTIGSWMWDLGNGQTPTYTNGSPFTAAYSAAGIDTVRLTVISDKGCYSDPYKKSLTVHPLPVVNFNMPTSVCLPGSASFSSTSTVGDGSALSYQWNFGDNTANGSGATVSHAYIDSNSYNVTLTATSAFGCVKDSVKVFSAFFNKPRADFSVNKAELCQGEENEFTDLSTAAGSAIVKRLWKFGNGVTDTTATPDITYSTPGTYTVLLQVTNAVGCTADTSKQVVVHLQPKIDAGPSFVVPVGTDVRFNPTVNSQNLQFTWTPGVGLSNANMLRPTITALRNGIYYFTATGAGGCTATDSLTVQILLPVNIPNAFSPNGDGIHDTWNIENLKDYPGATVEVFNRYGQKVFQSNGYSVPWDGRYNGAVLPFATYYYVITLRNGFAPITGSITIVR